MDEKQLTELNVDDQSVKRETPKIWKEVKEWVISIAAAFIIAILIQNYAVAQTQVEQDSMQNTLFEGQRLIEDKITYYFQNPKQGDVVIISGSEYEHRLVKRVIGLPGDVIDMKDGNVYVNDEQLEEPYAKGVTYPNGMTVPYTVPKDHYFVLGDNRQISLDSRALGPIHEDDIEGRVIFRIWPLSEFGSID
ncbi:signal peptidase I [Marinicrinis lubricantis]|uniref:Signal peptidase I n=1 Tax=Marinicrinis lubricantis TaxID=2086470 RepID=A0ABW1IL61_9BACL